MSASRPFFSPVGLSNSLEPKLGWLAFPGLIRGIVIIHAVIFVLLLMRGEDAVATLALFVFDWDQILAGEVWRLISFIMIPPVGIGGSPTLAVLFMFIAMMIAFLINDLLEQSWGVFRTTLYCYGIFFCQILAHLILGFLEIAVDGSQGGVIFYQAIFLAFATTVPRYEFRLFFVLPVQVWVLGAALGAYLVLQCFGGLFNALYYFLCFAPYLVWALPRFVRWVRQREHSAARRANFQAKSKRSSDHFHTCDRCGATDVSHSDRDFRVTEDGGELCDACLQSEASEGDPVKKIT